MFSTRVISVFVACGVPLHDCTADAYAGCVSVITRGNIAQALTHIYSPNLQKTHDSITVLYLPGHKCVLEKFVFMVMLHLLQFAFFKSLLPAPPGCLQVMLLLVLNCLKGCIISHLLVLIQQHAVDCVSIWSEHTICSKSRWFLHSSA